MYEMQPVIKYCAEELFYSYQLFLFVLIILQTDFH